VFVDECFWWFCLVFSWEIFLLCNEAGGVGGDRDVHDFLFSSNRHGLLQTLWKLVLEGWKDAVS